MSETREQGLTRCIHGESPRDCELCELERLRPEIELLKRERDEGRQQRDMMIRSRDEWRSESERTDKERLKLILERDEALAKLAKAEADLQEARVENSALKIGAPLTDSIIERAGRCDKAEAARAQMRSWVISMRQWMSGCKCLSGESRKNAFLECNQALASDECQELEQQLHDGFGPASDFIRRSDAEAQTLEKVKPLVEALQLIAKLKAGTEPTWLLKALAHARQHFPEAFK